MTYDSQQIAATMTASQVFAEVTRRQISIGAVKALIEKLDTEPLSSPKC